MQFTEKDLIQFQERGIKSLEIERQLDLLMHGFQYPELLKSAKIGQGIHTLTEQEREQYRSVFKKDSNQLSLIKFIPASGAASRMFAHLMDYFNFNESNDLTEQFFERLDEFAFYPQLSEEIKLDRKKILNFLLVESRFNQLPKALIPFHQNKSETFTPFHSHLSEGLKYSEDRVVDAHFTITEESQEDFHLALADEKFLAMNNRKAKIHFSFQEKQTDTISIDEKNEIVRDENDSIVFRPGGHGALLKNLQQLNEDLIFIRNIDNVLSPFANDEYVQIHQEMAGMLIQLQKVIYAIQKKVAEGILPDEQELNILQTQFSYTGKAETNSIHDFVFRPIRICGMVKNDGEPGGGPFWIKEKNGSSSLQIIESSQVNPSDHHQLEIFKTGTHFNPVDICCSIKNYKGEKYDLFQFRNEDYSFLAKKNYRGKMITVLEHPGLWNGSMHHWLTLFIEIPNTVFNPVKTVNDLLRPAHLK